MYTQELENKINSYETDIEDLKKLHEEKNKKFENMKSISNQSTEELIKNNNDLIKIKSENKNLTEKLENINDYLEKLNNEINNKERIIRQMKHTEETLTQQIKSEKEKIENKFFYEKNNLIDKIEYLEKEAQLNIEQIRNLTKENKNLNDKLRFFSDYNIIKTDLLNIREKFEKNEEENIFLKNQNNNLQKQSDNLIQSLAVETKKGDQARIEVYKFLFVLILNSLKN